MYLFNFFIYLFIVVAKVQSTNNVFLYNNIIYNTLYFAFHNAAIYIKLITCDNLNQTLHP